MRAGEQRLLLHPGYAQIAADTLADVLESTRGDFGGQERIGNARARRADDVALAAAQRFHHVIGAGEPAVADDRHRRADDGLHVRHEGPHPVRLAKARAPRILAPFLVVADLDRPEVAHALAMHQFDEMQTFVVMLNPEFAVDRIGLETRRDRQAIAHGTLQRRHDLDVKTRPIGE